MAIQWTRASKGVRYYEHETRKYGKRKDRYYSLSYKLDGKTINEGLGWESENRIPGESMQSRAERLFAQLKENQRTGKGPRTLTEMREIGQKQREEEDAAVKAEALRLVPLQDFFEREFVPFALRSKKESSAKKEFSLFNTWVRPFIGDKPLVEISMPDWFQIVNRMDAAGLATSSKRYVCGTLCRILKLAQDQEHDITIIPTMKKLGLGEKEENRRTRVISDEELVQILDTLRNRNLCAYHIVVFGALTGCRFNEAASLTWGDISEEIGIIFKNTKNKQTRIIPFSDSLRQFFSYLPRKDNNEIVFKNTQGNKYNEAPQPFKDVIKELHLNDNRNKLDRISYHSFRHTMATKLGTLLDLRSLMDTLGWKRVAMAARYMHGNDDLKKSALDVVAPVSIIK